jgi:hypothetical protein
MPGKNERDPLDEWLEREIQPLPPPPGTFTMITKRARRRKLGKLAITMTSAAAVAAAVVFAVPTVLALHIGQPAVGGSSVANGKLNTQVTSRPSGTTSEQTSTAHPATSSPETRPSTATPATYPTGGPVPSNFRPTSVTFISTNTGWLLGQGGPPCATKFCTSMTLTRDGGQTWHGVPAPKTDGVTGIRFLDGKNGWAYGPELWATHDYGNTWSAINTFGQQVIDLETAGTQAFAVFATCSAATSAPGITLFGKRCTDFQLEQSPAGADHWSAVTLSGNGGSGGPLTMSGPGPQVVTIPTIVLQSGTGWLVGPLGQLFSGSLTAGTWQQLSGSPCGANSASTPASAMLGRVLTSGALVWACNDAQGTQAAVYSSADGVTWTKQMVAPSSAGQVTGLSASPAAPYILATTQGIEVLDASTGQWSQAVSVKGGFSYIGMTSNQQGVAVPADPSLREIWMSINGGLNWTPYQF